MFPIKYIDNNLVWNKDNEVFAYYELIPYNYSFLSAEQKFIVCWWKRKRTVRIYLQRTSSRAGNAICKKRYKKYE